MDVKTMREKLSEFMDTVPRSNDDVIKVYSEKFGEVESVPSLKVVGKNIYTYIGKGEESPHLIKFMGIQVFTRGKPVEVKNEQVLAKISGNPCFVKGEVTQEVLYENDEKAKEKADLQRDEDTKTQIAVERLNRKAG